MYLLTLFSFGSFMKNSYNRLTNSMENLWNGVRLNRKTGWSSITICAFSEPSWLLIGDVNSQSQTLSSTRIGLAWKSEQSAFRCLLEGVSRGFNYVQCSRGQGAALFGFFICYWPMMIWALTSLLGRSLAGGERVCSPWVLLVEFTTRQESSDGSITY